MKSHWSVVSSCVYMRYVYLMQCFWLILFSELSPRHLNGPTFHRETRDGGDSPINFFACLRWIQWKFTGNLGPSLVLHPGIIYGTLETILIPTYMGVSKNNGIPKSSFLIGFSIINHPFCGTPLFGNTLIKSLHQLISTYIYYLGLLDSLFRGANGWRMPIWWMPQRLLRDEIALEQYIDICLCLEWVCHCWQVDFVASLSTWNWTDSKKRYDYTSTLNLMNGFRFELINVELE